MRKSTDMLTPSSDRDIEHKTRIILRSSKRKPIEAAESLSKDVDHTLVDKLEPTITKDQKSRISIVAWQNTYSLDSPEIDEQHKALFDLINNLWEVIANRTSVEDQRPLIDRLESYTLTHFSQEESFMQGIKYPKFDAHKKMHDQFAQRIAEEKARVVAGNGFSLDILYFLKDWLVNHILVSDRDYVDFSKADQSKSFIVRLFKKLSGKG
ncbi:MAG: hemerythrin [Pseudomonadota bacterium]|nr:hemerythrin [Pseudomonadota bacterium]